MQTKPDPKTLTEFFHSVFPAILFVIIFSSCHFSAQEKDTANRREKTDFDRFGKYWYQGKAEISTYDLEQYRYGEKRRAEAALIFVTEDFSRKKQVKLDNPQANQTDAQKVLKFNLTKKFVTGVYPYSLMLSVFTPVYEAEPAVKVSASCQEWCGQTYTQLNYRNGRYKAVLMSHFESDADQEINLNARTEDELWNLIRISPELLPTGKVNLIPSLLDQRFTHLPLKAYNAEIELSAASATFGDFPSENLKVLEVKYSDYPRELRVYFSDRFPYQIAGWEEIHRTQDGKTEVSRATRKALKMLDYWNRHNSASENLRQELQIRNVE
jgi:hypothetical protein